MISLEDIKKYPWLTELSDEERKLLEAEAKELRKSNEMGVPDSGEQKGNLIEQEEAGINRDEEKTEGKQKIKKLVPAIVAGLVFLAVVSIFGYQALKVRVTDIQLSMQIIGEDTDQVIWQDENGVYQIPWQEDRVVEITALPVYKGIFGEAPYVWKEIEETDVLTLESAYAQEFTLNSMGTVRISLCARDYEKIIEINVYDSVAKLNGLGTFAGQYLSWHASNDRAGKYGERVFVGKTGSFETLKSIMAEYLALMEEQGYVLIDMEEQTGGLGTTYAYYYKYTGYGEVSSVLPKEVVDSQRVQNCHVKISYQDYRKLMHSDILADVTGYEICVWFVSDIQFTDLGYRTSITH